MVQHENEDLFYVYPEFNQDSSEININCIVYSDLPISKMTKLKEIYKSGYYFYTLLAAAFFFILYFFICFNRNKSNA